ncbi:TPA: hypothetical protein ACSTJ0_000250 [Serratia fonticola]|jgi:hypothetical protein|uniref:hypothetical protein n=1 Tax=Serratia fonticola TaxID=47917 RepID=UPI002179BB7D|nr:hypothetical protein [Serratia fonticola]CAI0779334.1 Uncharacterised protein [Serratia fonticola]CAI0780203.1 Uncharacterised protein [Serratia fonticola]CAI0907723.1 Uncharacterised protein [Serratia fonticola]CAI1516949.1 Uncharacterised protein [Serratia fonticola]CAI1609814.1 Uncharacterised protein [Serratia fonticola]
MKIILTPLLIAFIVSGLFYYHHHQIRPFRCDAQSISHIEQGEDKVDLNLNVNIIFTLHNEGVLSFTGSVKHAGREYLVNRELFFTSTPSELEGTNKTKITREEINKNDELPLGLWQQYILSKVQGTEFYTNLTAVNHNGMLLQELSNPLFVCVRSEN